MTTLELWLLAVGLAMDCFTIAIASGILLKRIHWRTILITSLSFGLFQTLMPFLGWYATKHFRHLIESCDHWIAFGLLGFLGGKMIYESFKEEENQHHFDPHSPKVILAFSVATSIDALAVGISFTCMGYQTMADMISPLSAIGLMSFLMAFAGFMIGIFAGQKFHFPVERIGGIILILIGCKVLYTHLMGMA